jgi:hypothetical protein
MANIVPLEEAKDLAKSDLLSLMEYYRRFFSPKQIDVLLLFWYGLDIGDVSEYSQVSISILDTWLSDPAFVSAVKAGRGRQQEILTRELERQTVKAMQVVNSILSKDVDPGERGFSEVAKTARWLLDKFTVNPNQQGDDTRNTARMDEATAKILAEELARLNHGTSERTVDIERLMRNDIIDGEIIDAARYVKVVSRMDLSVNHGILNVYKNDDEIKLQCHLCGKWYTSLISHLRNNSIHKGISADFYRTHFGIPSTVPLVVDEELLDILERAKSEYE